MQRLLHIFLVLLLLCSLPVRAYAAAAAEDCSLPPAAPLTQPHQHASMDGQATTSPGHAAPAGHGAHGHHGLVADHVHGKCHGGACCIAAALPMSSYASPAALRAATDPAPFAMRSMPPGVPSRLDRPPRLPA